MAIESINPATGETLETYEDMPRAAVDDIISKTHEAFLAWRRTSFEERARAMRHAAQVLRAKAEEYSRLMAQEMGKPVRDGIAEAQKCARLPLRLLPALRLGARIAAIPFATLHFTIARRIRAFLDLLLLVHHVLL